MTALGIRQMPLFTHGRGRPERREEREEVVRHVVYCPFPRASSEQRERVGFTRDLSPSGLCVRADAPEPVGSLLRVTLRSVEGRPRFESIARVCWSQRTVDGACWLGLALLEESRPRPLRVRPRPRRAEVA